MSETLLFASEEKKRGGRGEGWLVGTEGVRCEWSGEVWFVFFIWEKEIDRRYGKNVN